MLYELRSTRDHDRGRVGLPEYHDVQLGHCVWHRQRRFHRCRMGCNSELSPVDVLPSVENKEM